MIYEFNKYNRPAETIEYVDGGIAARESELQNRLTNCECDFLLGKG